MVSYFTPYVQYVFCVNMWQFLPLARSQGAPCHGELNWGWSLDGASATNTYLPTERERVQGQDGSAPGKVISRVCSSSDQSAGGKWIKREKIQAFWVGQEARVPRSVNERLVGKSDERQLVFTPGRGMPFSPGHEA
jgi:hypothetical protein